MRTARTSRTTRGSAALRLLFACVLALLLAGVIGAWLLFLPGRSPSGGPTHASTPPLAGSPAPAPGPNSPREPAVGPVTRRGDPVAAPRHPLEEIPPPRARELSLFGRAVLFGVVSSTDGTPVAGAGIWFDGDLVTETDEQGRYRFECEPVAVTWEGSRPRYPMVAAVKPGLGSDVREFPERGGRLDLTLCPHLGVRGRATETRRGLPVKDTQIELWCLPDLEGMPRRIAFRRTVRADSHGRFEISGLPPGRLALRATAPGHGMATWSQQRLEDESLTDLALGMVPSIRLTGRFVKWPLHFEHETPLSVQISAPQNSVLSNQLEDDDGSFALELLAPPAKFLLTLESPRGILWRREFRVDRFSPEHDLGVLAVDDPARITGRVSLPPALLELGLALRVIHIDGGPTSARDYPIASDGSFDAMPVAPGAVSIGVVSGDELLAPLGIRYVEGASRTDLGSVDVTDPVYAGRVLYQGAAPLARATVELQMQRQDGAWATVTSQTVDREGRYLLRTGEVQWESMRDRPLRLVAELKGRLRPCVQEIGPHQAGVQFHELSLERGRELVGRLEATGGGAAAGWFVACSDPITGEAFTDTTARDGSFVISGLLEQAYEVWLQSPQGIRYRMPPVAPGSGSVRWSVRDAAPVESE